MEYKLSDLPVGLVPQVSKLEIGDRIKTTLIEVANACNKGIFNDLFRLNIEERRVELKCDVDTIRNPDGSIEIVFVKKNL